MNISKSSYTAHVPKGVLVYGTEFMVYNLVPHSEKPFIYKTFEKITFKFNAIIWFLFGHFLVIILVIIW
ncbi:hypothetical protein AB986_04735 [Alkalihalobacillus macyae]|uniref:Uncharacterized protein n=1 Tax=Guptibacillus hwajinpoensis TaxID=208199 RepID=A0A0J6D2R3_9BACL|nr:hypothetical protein AB986_04735 [Alkalihalobacillus macyae]